MAKVLCVRHGNTFLPDEEPRRVGGRTDLPLVASGREQAAVLGQYFREVEMVFTRVFCSPLQRTRQTAEIVLQEMGLRLEPVTLPFLREIDYGPDENQPEALVKQRLGEALAKWDAEGIVPPGWDLDRELVVQQWKDFFREQGALDGTTLVVTSNGIARFLLDACAYEPGKVASRKLRTGAFAEIEATPAGAVLQRWDVRP